MITKKRSEILFNSLMNDDKKAFKDLLEERLERKLSKLHESMDISDLLSKKKQEK